MIHFWFINIFSLSHARNVEFFFPNNVLKSILSILNLTNFSHGQLVVYFWEGRLLNVVIKHRVTNEK